MGMKIRSISAALIGFFLLLSPNNSLAAKKQASPKRAVAAPVKAPIQDGLVYQYLISQVGGYGRDCPENTTRLTDWKSALQFLPRTVGSKTNLIISGKFVAGDSQRLRAYLASSGPISEIWLDSGGGNAAEGPLVGDVIRAARLKTRVAEGFACISSCSMAFLGGIIRQIDDNAIYGLHTFYNSSFLPYLGSKQTSSDQDNTFHQNERGNAILAGQIQTYGQKMGISRDFFTKIMFVQRSRVVVTDRTLNIMRQDMIRVMTAQQANEYVKILISKGILYDEYPDEKVDADNVFKFLINQHTPVETDRVIGKMLQSYRCYGKNVLASYNVINIVR